MPSKAVPVTTTVPNTTHLPSSVSGSKFLLLVSKGHLEVGMNIRGLCSVLILGGLAWIVAPANPALAQSSQPGVSAPNDSAASALKSARQNTKATPTKHRYWRHRGGKHPHYGSRRVRTTPQP
jgi:hypothetical protein